MNTIREEWKNMKAHLLFEQSGTFKNEFIKLGIEAYDYDILDDFGQTDYKIDLFNEIDTAFEGGVSIFDKISKEDICIAFFPCTLFQEHNSLLFRCVASKQKNYTDEQKLKYVLDRHKKLHDMYMRLCKLMLVALNKGLRMIIENPYIQPHYLNLYFPIKPTLIDKDRTLNGDYYKKPTQFWFLNINPKNNVIFEPLEYVECKTIEHQRKEGDITAQVLRSMIHPQYARRFIKQYIID